MEAVGNRQCSCMRPDGMISLGLLLRSALTRRVFLCAPSRGRWCTDVYRRRLSGHAFAAQAASFISRS